METVTDVLGLEPKMIVLHMPERFEQQRGSGEQHHG